MPGRALNVSDDAGHKLMPRPAAMCSRHSSIVLATAPMTGMSPPGRGTTSQSSRHRDGRHPSEPAMVSTTPRLVRSSSKTPTASSSCRTCADRTCWATWARWAAAVKLASSATATK